MKHFLRKYRFENYTPHQVNLYDGEGRHILFSLPVQKNAGQNVKVRVEEHVESVDRIAGIPVVRKTYGAVQGLPDPKEGVIYIVSNVVLQALKNSRDDLLCPDTGEDSVVRDGEGNICGVRRLQC